jgi:hypothetical protein
MNLIFTETNQIGNFAKYKLLENIAPRKLHIWVFGIMMESPDTTLLILSKLQRGSFIGSINLFLFILISQ